MSNATEITKVQVVIRRFLWETRDVVNDGESSRRWLESFRNTLQYQDLNDNPEPYAVTLLSEARKFNEIQLRKQQIRWVRESLKKEGIENPSKEQIETRWKELYGESSTDADEQTKFNDQVTTTRGKGTTTSCTIITDGQKRTGGHSPSSQSPSSRPPVRTSRRIPRPRSFDEVVEFADHEGLDYDDVRLWWERNFVERPGCDKDGVVFDNWKGALINACKAEERKRNGENKT